MNYKENILNEYRQQMDINNPQINTKISIEFRDL